MMFVLLLGGCAPGAATDTGDRPEEALLGTGCLYGVRDLMGIDWTLVLVDGRDDGALSAGGGGHAPAMSDWFALDVPASECGVEDDGSLSSAHDIPWAADLAPHDSRLAACLADEEPSEPGCAGAATSTATASTTW